MLFPYTAFAYIEEDAYQLTSIVPSDSSILIGFNLNDVITFTTNADSIFGGFDVEIWDSDTNSIIYKDFTDKKDSEDEWKLTIYRNLIFLKGHTYSVKMTGHEGQSSLTPIIAKFSATYIGNGTSSGEEDDTDYEYSNITFDYFSLPNGFKFDNDRSNFIVIGFTGEVAIDEERSKILDENGVPHSFQISPFENDPLLKKILIFPKEILSNCISHFNVFIYAKDMGGRVVKGNSGKGINSHWELTYYCDLGYPKLLVTPLNGIIRTLPKLTFSYSDGISILSEDKQISLFKEDKETVVQTINNTELEESTDFTSFTYHFNDTLKTEGIYYLYIPENTFGLSPQKLPNREIWVKYEIVDRLGMYGVEITPEETDTVPSLSKISITFYRWDSAFPYYQNKDTITVTDETGQTVIALAEADYDVNRIIENQCFIQLKTPITQTGHYILNVPAKAFILGSDRKNLSDSMYFEFDVKEPPFVIPDYTYDTELDENLTLRYILVAFPEYELARVTNSTDAILTDTLGVEVAKGKILIGRYRNQLCITLYDEYNLKTESDYVLTLSANSFSLNGERYKADFEVRFHFDPTTSDIHYTETASANSNVRVYNAQGIFIREGESQNVLKGLKGLYIVNGRKTFIK